MKMKTMNQLIELQGSYEEIRQYNKILKDGSQIYLLKKLKSDFQEDKTKYTEKCAKLEVIKKELMEFSHKINSEKHVLKEKEMMLDKAKSKEHKLMEELMIIIENIKARIKKLEDDSLVLMEEEENLYIEKEKLRVELLNIKNNFNIKKEEVNNEIISAQSKIDGLKKEVKILEQAMPENIMKIYTEIKGKHDNVVVSLEAGMCSGCRMKVSAITVDDIYKDEGLVFCSNCGRILFHNKNNLNKAK
jgi:predicted  nucleic acid-binding Zn-ribbon protein